MLTDESKVLEDSLLRTSKIRAIEALRVYKKILGYDFYTIVKDEHKLIHKSDGEFLAWLLEDIPEIKDIRQNFCHNFSIQDFYKDLL